MASYRYIARSIDGQEVTGVMQADSKVAVAGTLDERQLFPISIAESEAPRTPFRRRVKLAEVGVMYGQLGDLLHAGVPMLRALDTLARVGLSKRLAHKVARVREDVAAGEPLADALGHHGETFAHLHCAIIRAGERAGFLDEALSNLASFIDRQDDLRSKVRGALIYPAVLAVLGTVAVTGILVGLVPRFKPLFANFELQAPTRILFAVSDLLVHHLAVVVGAIAIAAILARAFVRSRSGRLLWDRWRMRLPLVGRVIRLVSITRFCRVLGTMLANGVSILQALEIGKDATGSKVMARSIAQASDRVRAGEPLAEPLRRSGLFPAEVVEMIAVAEESNQMERVLVQIADTVEHRTNRQVDVAVRMMEPLILVVMAVMIGFVAVGLMIPMFNMSQAFE